MTHAPGFLKLVDDAKSRVGQIDIEGYKKMVATKEPHSLVDTREDGEWADGRVAGAVHLSKGIIERDIEQRIPDTQAPSTRTRPPSWCCIAAADSARRWRQSIYNGWATPTSFRSTAAGAR